MKITKLIVQNDDGTEVELVVKDGAGFFICNGGQDENDQVLQQNTSNASINLRILQNILVRMQ